MRSVDGCLVVRGLPTLYTMCTGTLLDAEVGDREWRMWEYRITIIVGHIEERVIDQHHGDRDGARR